MYFETNILYIYLRVIIRNNMSFEKPNLYFQRKCPPLQKVYHISDLPKDSKYNLKFRSIKIVKNEIQKIDEILLKNEISVSTLI